VKPGARIGFVSATLPDDLHAQSGAPWFMRQALERYCGDVVNLGPTPPWFARPLRVASRVSQRLPRRYRFIDTNSDTLSRAYSRSLSATLLAAEHDWLFAPYASAEIAHLETDRPIVYYSDATFRVMCDYYTGFTGLSRRARQAGDDLERRAIDRAAVACFASDWAATSAIRDYGAAPEKVCVVPLSANLSDPPAYESLRFERYDKAVRLLFVGVDWERKGGPIAHDALASLHRAGVPASLTVVGCAPPPRFRTANVSVVGFLSKNNPQQRRRLESLFRDADFLIMPTRAECYGCVFVEAAAFALPSLAPHTGGVSSAMASGSSGLLFDQNATGDDYAAAIIDVLGDENRYRALRRSARRAFDTQLGWEAWGRRLNQVTADFRASPRRSVTPVSARATT